MFDIYRNRITGETKFLVNFFNSQSNPIGFLSLQRLNFYHFLKTRCHIKIIFSFTIGRSMQKKLSVQKDAIIKEWGKSGNIYFEILQNKRMKRRKNLLKRCLDIFKMCLSWTKRNVYKLEYYLF